MAWTNSKVFRPTLYDILDNATQIDLNGTDVFKAALYNDSITPDNDVASAAAAYSAGVWSATGGPTGTPQVYETGQWAQGGQTITTPVLNQGTADVVFWAAGGNTASGSAADLQNATDALVYDDTIATPVAKQAISYNWFGGPNSVVNGTFTIVWNALGIFRATL